MRQLDYYQQRLERFLLPSIDIHTTEGLYAITLGLASEAGEAAGKLYKEIRDGKQDRRGFALELGDVWWHLNLAATGSGYTMQQVVDLNLEKLLHREKMGTISGSGDHR